MVMFQRQQPVRPAAPQPRRSGPPTFLYGLGAAKAGTTWLYRYLRSHPECHLRGYKELHYFDVIEKGLVMMEAKRVGMEIDTIKAKLPKLPPKVREQWFTDMLDRRDFQQVLLTCRQDKNAYFRYMMAGLGNQRLVADITPDYAGVTVDMLRKMVGSADETRFVYLMRDPVARLWSHVRMGASGGMPDGEDPTPYVRDELARILAGEMSPIVHHCDYRHVMEKMEAAIPEERRMIMFYEDLMTPTGLKSLCKFLGIKPISGNFQDRANEGKSIKMTAEERAGMRRMLRPQYEAAAARFPVLPEAWRKTMAEGFE